MSSQPGPNDRFPWTVTLADGSKWIAPGSLTFHVEDGGALVARDIDGAKAVKHAVEFNKKCEPCQQHMRAYRKVRAHRTVHALSREARYLKPEGSTPPIDAGIPSASKVSLVFQATTNVCTGERTAPQLEAAG